MKFSKICKILNCPTDVVAGESFPADAVWCQELEDEMVSDWQLADDAFDYWEYMNDFDY